MSLKNNRNNIHYSAGDRAFLATDALILTLAFLVVLYPLLFVLSSSFSGGSEISNLSLIPEHFSLEGYKAAVEYAYFWGSYWNSIVYTVLGTLAAMIVYHSVRLSPVAAEFPCRKNRHGAVRVHHVFQRRSDSHLPLDSNDGADEFPLGFFAAQCTEHL